MARRRTSGSYTIRPFQVGSDQSEIDLLMINFQADSLTNNDLCKKCCVYEGHPWIEASPKRRRSLAMAPRRYGAGDEGEMTG